MGPNPNGPSSVSCETELLDTQVFSGSVKSGSCLGFLGFFVCCCFFSEEETKRHGKKGFDSPQPDFCFGGGANLHFTPRPTPKKNKRIQKSNKTLDSYP